MQIYELLSAAEELNYPDISTYIHSFCASVVHVVQIISENPYEQTAPLLENFDAQQKMWINRLLQVEGDIPDESVTQASLYMRDDGVGHILASLFANPHTLHLISTSRSPSPCAPCSRPSKA